jgi:hypothetical protein
MSVGSGYSCFPQLGHPFERRTPLSEAVPRERDEALV